MLFKYIFENLQKCYIVLWCTVKRPCENGKVLVFHKLLHQKAAADMLISNKPCQLKPRGTSASLWLILVRYCLVGYFHSLLKKTNTQQKFYRYKLRSCRVSAGHHPLPLGKGTDSGHQSLHLKKRRDQEEHSNQRSLLFATGETACRPPWNIPLIFGDTQFSSITLQFTSWGASQVTSRTRRHKRWLSLSSRSNKIRD